MVIALIILLLVDLVVVSFLTEKRDPNPVGAIFFIGGTFAIWHFFIQKIDFEYILTYAKDNISTLLLYLLAWTIIGVLWSFVRWYILLKDTQRYRLSLSEKEYKDLVDNKWGYIKGTIPQASREKERIITWMIYWPFSVVGIICRNWITRFYSFLYSKVSGVYDSMTSSVFK